MVYQGVLKDATVLLSILSSLHILFGFASNFPVFRLIPVFNANFPDFAPNSLLTHLSMWYHVHGVRIGGGAPQGGGQGVLDFF